MAAFKVFFSLILFISACYCESEKEVEVSPRLGLNIELDLEQILGSFDPLVWLPDVKLNFNKLDIPKIVKGLFSVEKVELSGFSKGTLPFEFFLTPFMGVRFGLKMKEAIVIKSEYLTDFVAVDLIKAKGYSGNFTLTLKDIDLKCELRLMLKSSKIPIEFKVENIVSKGDPKIELTGFLGDNDKSMMIGEEVADLLKMVVTGDLLKSLMQTYLMPILNALLFAFDITLDKLMGLLG